MSIKCKAHLYGFFSCCSVRLYDIINFFNSENQVPALVDSTESFGLYKKHENHDLVFDFFEKYETPNSSEYSNVIPIDCWMFQFTNYKDIPYSRIIPFVKTYFKPNQTIQKKSDNLIIQYNINLENCIAVYYRGTDKKCETHIDRFDSFYNKIIDLFQSINNEKTQILIQTDTTQFVDYIKPKLVDKNVIIIKENTTSNTEKGIHYENNNIQNYNDIQILLSISLIMSKCKHIICTSGNVSIWTMFFRENAENVHQNLNCKWL
jgi:hypothetical protein